MSELENKILAEDPDFDNQYAILKEERKFVIKKRVDIAFIICMFLLIVVIIYWAYSLFYVYHKFSHNTPVDIDSCKNVNVKNVSDDDINIASNGSCIPSYNIDYLNNRKPTFNIDIYGDGSYLFNPVNQLDDNGLCKVNCDFDKDGWPDYNIDINGDGTIDLNVIKEKNPNSYTCDLNCDINFDTIPDTNIDTNNDGIADINITKDDYKVAVYNIDYLGNLKATFNILNDDGSISNKVSDSKNFTCDENCDIDGDGHPDYNINYNGFVLNKLNHVGDISTLTNIHFTDWKCNIGLKECESNVSNKNNTYVNIDINGDGIADINILNDDGILTNEINKSNSMLNVDSNSDGFPDYNIDINNDGIADLNIMENNKCVKNCDTNNDGKADYLIDEKWTIYNINNDTNYDGKCNVNCDVNNDLKPDINIDTNNDTMPDINIDYDLDLISDFNIDSDNDYIADKNIDNYLLGVCNENCEGKTLVSSKYDDENEVNLLEYNEENTMYVVNPLSIENETISPGYENIYVMYIKNSNKYATKYEIYWDDVKNEFTSNNLNYFVNENGVKFLEEKSLPLKNETLKTSVIIKANTVVKYVMHVNLVNENYNQIEDSGKSFSGKLKVKVVE